MAKNSWWNDPKKKADRGKAISDAARRRREAGMRPAAPQYNGPIDPATGKRRPAHTGQKRTDQTKERMSEAQMRVWRERRERQARRERGES